MSFSDQYITLPETNSKFAPENGWLEDELVSFLANPIFGCEVLVSGRVMLGNFIVGTDRRQEERDTDT